MRKFLVALTALFVVSSPAAAANWVHLSADNDGGNYYADLDSVRIVGRYLSIWRRADHAKPDKFGDIQSKSLLYFDCANRTSAIKSWITYNAAGAVTGSKTYDDYALTFDSIAPDTIGETWLNRLCGK